ncbi:BspA family leucine-rich repeat surface protein [Mesonia aquimarina]|uniref:BspA family leucine-rich repeat surface protein n=1 Tax=Mesonia aquimarina TaxID=1504967 RepID=UPI000EF5C254|nr:BspA family leucine-rich repeat surface protein [Mesonia aquimarina]
MKNLYTLIFLTFISFTINAQNQPFITTWGVSSFDGLDITIPTKGTGYNYTIDFGDGTVENNVTGDVSHTYNSSGIYTVSITGDFPRICFGNYWFTTSNMEDKIASVEQWGDIQWYSMSEAFYGCDNLNINATDIPDLSQVTDMSSMLREVNFINSSINNWDVSNVTNMSYLFAYADSFNQPLDNWDVSSVINMESMFWEAYSFNQSIDNWDVSNVTNMVGMFSNAAAFNQDIENWDVSNVTNMAGMFSSTGVFNKSLNNWNTSNVTDMSGMFKNANSFNQPLNNWNTSNVTNMNSMFTSNGEFNQPLDNWDVSNVTNMGEMFASKNTGIQMSFNHSLENWDVSNVTNMGEMFFSNSSFNQPLNNWDVSNVSLLSGMFYKATSFNQPLNNWDVSNVTFMTGVFFNATTFNQDLSAWEINTTNLTNFLSNSGLDINNYDYFLSHLNTLGLMNGFLVADGLEYCDQSSHDYLENILGWNILSDSQSPNCNSINGEITYDENNNGCDPADQGVSGFMVNANDGTDDLKTYSSNGSYTLGTIGTNFTVSVMNYPSYYSISPASQNVTFNTSSTEVVDFCVTANQNIEDLNITLLPTSEARPGFEADYQLVVENLGTQNVANATVTVDFDDAMQSFVSASVTPTSTTTNQLSFDITNLQPLTNQKIDFTQQTFQPPTVNGNDILNFNATVTPNANDNTPTDNTFIFDQVVVNSYDPNDKQVLQGEEIYEEETDEYLDYLIRFQNTGTASAINVRILDTLHPKLDYSTLKPVSASHNYHIEITDENQVEFIFDNINLPDENTNEPASHGFVAYKIKPKSDVAVGDFIEGDARIYFDFNAPIITNMASTEIIDDLSTDPYIFESSISLYPNPTQNILNIETKNKAEIKKLKLFNLNGIQIETVVNNKKQLNVENLSNGIYFIKITTNQGTVTKRFVKK